jgi:hypothetical protein
MMAFQLYFTHQEKYDSRNLGINLKTTLHYGEHFLVCDAKIDTGAEVCLFERVIGETLEISIENGIPKKMSTLAGTLMAYGHEVILETLGLRFHTIVYFAESYEVKRNLLGRQGWLQLIKLGLVDYDNELYLSPYDE